MVVTADYKRPELPKVYLGHQSVVIYHKCTHTHGVLITRHRTVTIVHCPTVHTKRSKAHRQLSATSSRVEHLPARSRTRTRTRTHAPLGVGQASLQGHDSCVLPHTHTQLPGAPACDLPRHRQVNLNQTTRDTAVHADNPADRSQTHAHTCCRSQTHAHAHTHARAATSSPSTNVSPSHATSRR